HHFVLSRSLFLLILFFFLDTAPTEIYTLSLHDALPILDDVDQYQRIVEFLNQIQPNLVSRVRLYRREEPIFDEFGIEPEIGSSLKSKVWLKSGGYIVINQTEALVAIDVNTGKYVGKRNLEETVFKTNLEAAK